MSVLDRDEPIEIGGKTYKILFNNRALINVERECVEGSIIKMMANQDSILSFTNIFTLFKHGMLAGNKGLAADEVEELFSAAVDNYGTFANVGDICYKSLMKCGLVTNGKMGAARNA